jgi:hypothetical protein
VPGFKPNRLLMKLPDPDSLLVLLLLIVGLLCVLQHIPLSVIKPPPSAAILPPETAVLKVIEVTSVVVNVANSISDVFSFFSQSCKENLIPIACTSTISGISPHKVYGISC